MAIIPDELFDDYYEICNEFLNNDYIGKSCTVVYPAQKDVCPNCTVVKLASGSTNVYKSGGPYPFTVGLCPYCAGKGYSETETSEEIRLRVYWNKRDWKKISNNIQIPDAEVMTIGFIADMPKCQQASYVLMINEQSNRVAYRFTLAGEPFPHGFGKDHYFIAYWKRDK